ncbi:methyltransferase domain-containing protein [Paenibacillus sp. sgz500958]|uniref:MerR family transcriptional regulator n=1 Tax=Paenibacillus sp. sgz500958 TaxID=3242475 RepID=UPI0036D211A1
MKPIGWTTGQIARRTGMTVRTLRYYDRIGLLKPSQYEGDTRLYNESDMARLQKISMLKFIGLSLDEMKSLLENEGESTDLQRSLYLQQQLIRQKMRHMESVAKAIDSSILYMERQHQNPDWEELARIIQTVRSEKDWGEQYRNATRLQSRIHLYDRFSTNPIGWHTWFFDHVLAEAGRRESVAAPCRILDIGCGDGTLWTRNLERIPAYFEVTLADVSAGMLEDARSALRSSSESSPKDAMGPIETPSPRALSSSKNFPSGAVELNSARFRFLEADVQALPFAEEEFDIVIAGHMLYHVDHLPLGLSEISRVLQRSGSFLASTMSSRHLAEMEELARAFDPELRVLDDTIEQFNLYNGAELLSPWFPEVELVRYPDSLVVTEAGPLIRYMTSTPMNAGIKLQGETLERFTAYVERKVSETGS